MVAVAGLNDEGRARLMYWTKSAASRTYRLGSVAFVFLSLINGSLGVYVWGIDQTLLTRKEVLTLVLFLLNIGIGLAGINHLIELKNPAKNKIDQP